MLILNNITQTYPGRATPVLDNIHLSLKKGELCLLMGANGEGKSTLLNSIIMQNAHKKIAYVCQDIHKGMIGELTLLENMVLSQSSKSSGWYFYHRHKKKILLQLETLKTSGIDITGYIDKPLSVLSGGQRQLIATVMALAGAPDIVLFDEPLSALDVSKQALWVHYTQAYLKRYPIPALMVTHDLEHAITLGQRLLVLHQGQFVLDVSGDQKSSLLVSELLLAMKGERHDI